MGTTKKSNVFPIYLVTSKSRHRLAMTFVRFQEHFESPKFAGMAFTLEEFSDWYADQHDGLFSYSDDWSGFNIPSWVLERFRAGMFNPLGQKEKRFLDLVKGVGDPAYFIGMNVDKGIKIGTLRHEMVHALGHIDKKFYDDVANYVYLSQLGFPFGPIWEKFLGKLSAMGYGSGVVLGEAVAYLTTGLVSELSGFDPSFIKTVRHELRVRFKMHFGFSIHRADAVTLLDRIHVIDLDANS